MLRFLNNVLYIEKDGKLEPLLNNEEATFSYTLKGEDIRKRPKPDLTPYESYKKSFNDCLDIALKNVNLNDGLEFTLDIKNDRYSEWGINFPFNFMGKKNGGGYKNQYLFNSPYKDEDGRNNYLYLTNPNGHNILIVFKTEYCYWKMDYSPFCGGHFFINLKLLGQLDKEYTPLKQNNNQLVFYIKEVKDFNEALQTVSAYLNKPVLIYDISGGKLNTNINVKVYGNCDFISDGLNSYSVQDNKLTYQINQEGITTLTPYYNNEKGLSCTVYGYNDIESLYSKSIKAISFDDIAQTDGNLCEHQCYVSATLRYLLKYGKNVEYEEIAKKALSHICETDISKALPRITILDKPQGMEYPPYHLYKSNRIQEQFFGVTILLDAYKYFKDEKYLRYAVNSLNTLIDFYQREDGGFYTKMPWNDFYDDYSTVTCLIIPIIDMALFMKDIDKVRADKFALSASKLAEHVYNRGFDFPTESIVSDQYDPEMEDGSISCSALTLLYYYNKMEKKEEYLQKAEEILTFHESWVVKTPLVNAYRSSLRWWETGWEGDKDGPALCLGHAWSIWRGEADYWMYKATNNNEYLVKAINTFNTNFAKINSLGQSYSIYCIDYITGGGFEGKRELTYNIAPPFSKQTDSGLSRYVWIRAAASIIDEL